MQTIMRNIKDYIGKNYAIHCDTQEKYDKIYELLKEQQYKYWSGNQNYWKSYGEEFCFCLDEKDLTFASVDWCKNNYTILKAEEFLEPESLVGRYLKCLNSKSNWRSNLKKGDCFQITKVDSDGHFYIDHFCLDKSRVQELKEFELMPNGWTLEKEKLKFEIGKWYKATHRSLEKEVIFQFFKETNDYYYFYCGFTKPIESITWGYGESGSTWCFDKDEISNVQSLTDLSEIQQYLPDNHPDKQKPEETKPNLSDLYNTYIPLNNEEEYKQVSKWLESNGFKAINRIWHSDSKYIVVYTDKTFGIYNHKGTNTTKELSISDLSKYGFKLQQTSGNQIIINNEEWIPQVGEWVIVKHESGLDIGLLTVSNNEGFKKGFVGQVTKIEEEWVWLNNSKGAIKYKLLAKALPHEIPIEKHPMSLSSLTIEVGDEVELVSGCSYAGYNIGDKAIVIEKNSISFSVYRKGTTKIISGCVPKYWKIIRKNNTLQTTNTKTDDFGSLQVTNAQTTDIIIPKRASVTLKITEKEVNINIKKQKPVKI